MRQNLANLWRQNAFGQLVAGHRRFKVATGATAGYVLSMLGEAFVSNKEGCVSRAKIDGKIIAIYFRGSGSSTTGQVDSALREIHSHYQGGEGQAFEVVQVARAGISSPHEFASSFREMPWLAVPFAHVQRRAALRKLFDVADDGSMVVLLNQEGQCITLEGMQLLSLAHGCQKMVSTRLHSTCSLPDALFGISSLAMVHLSPPAIVAAQDEAEEGRRVP